MCAEIKEFMSINFSEKLELLILVDKERTLLNLNHQAILVQFIILITTKQQQQTDNYCLPCTLCKTNGR